MIKHIDITASQKNYVIDDDLTKYIQKKLGKLDKHMSRSNRDSARIDVNLSENTGKGAKKYTCEAIFHIPGRGVRLTASESTINMFAAVDIVENKLQNQLKKMKEKHSKSDDKHKNQRARVRLGKIFSR